MQAPDTSTHDRFLGYQSSRRGQHRPEPQGCLERTGPHIAGPHEISTRLVGWSNTGQSLVGSIVRAGKECDCFIFRFDQEQRRKDACMSLLVDQASQSPAKILNLYSFGNPGKKGWGVFDSRLPNYQKSPPCMSSHQVYLREVHMSKVSSATRATLHTSEMN